MACPTGVHQAVFSAVRALAMARQAEMSAEEFVVYFAGLADLDPFVVARACQRLAQVARQPYEPAMFELGRIRDEAGRVALDDAKARELRQLAPAPSSPDTDPRTWVFCRECEDTGQLVARCPGVNAPAPPTDRPERDADRPLQHCGRTTTHARHSHAGHCTLCAGLNPVIARRRESRAHASTR